MTCIVGYKTKTNVIIGADSLGASHYSKTIRKDVKIFKKKDFVIGFTTSYRMGQLLQYSFNIPEYNPKIQDIHEYLCTSFIKDLRGVFKENGWLQTKEGVEQGGSFLVGYKTRLFHIEDDFQVSESSDRFDACGSGEDFALGALKVLENDKNISPRDKVRTALKIASHFSTTVSAPFILLET